MTTTRPLTPDDPALPAALAIYRAAIPPSEQKSGSALLAALTRPDYRFRIAESANQVVGLTVVFTSDQFALLEYLAVHPAHRRRGVGSLLFNASLASAPHLPVLVEVESGALPEQERRRAFYCRNSCRLLRHCVYHLPLPGANPPPMTLMIRLPSPFPPLNATMLEDWLKIIYTRVYDVSDDDLRICETIRSLRNPVELE